MTWTNLELGGNLSTNVYLNDRRLWIKASLSTQNAGLGKTIQLNSDDSLIGMSTPLKMQP